MKGTTTITDKTKFCISLGPTESQLDKQAQTDKTCVASVEIHVCHGPILSDMFVTEVVEASSVKGGGEMEKQTHCPMKGDSDSVSCPDSMALSVKHAVVNHGQSMPLPCCHQTGKARCGECVQCGCPCEPHQVDTDTTGDGVSDTPNEVETLVTTHDMPMCSGSYWPCTCANNCKASNGPPVTSGSSEQVGDASCITDKSDKTGVDKACESSIDIRGAMSGNVDETSCPTVRLGMSVDKSVPSEQHCGWNEMPDSGSDESCIAAGHSFVPGALEENPESDSMTVCGSDHHIGMAHEIASSDYFEAGSTRLGGCHDDSVGHHMNKLSFGAGTLTGSMCSPHTSQEQNTTLDVASIVLVDASTSLTMDDSLVVALSVLTSCVGGSCAQSHSEKKKPKVKTGHVDKSGTLPATPSGEDETVQYARVSKNTVIGAQEVAMQEVVSEITCVETVCCSVGVTSYELQFGQIYCCCIVGGDT